MSTTTASPAAVQLGANLRAELERQGLTHAQLAELLGRQRSTVSHWASGRRELSVTDLLAVAAALDVPVVYLLRGLA